MAAITLTVNGQSRTVEASPDTPLLWVLREELGLTGTKYSCGEAECGACTVHVDGEATRSCVTPVARVAGKSVTTIEVQGNATLTALQRAWVEDQVPQCGFCHPGMLMQAAALLARNASPTDAEIDRAMAGNLCRCGTYLRVRRAIRRVTMEGTR
jgi:aerobic-type carbon monoxide dehydrogenase small subunit (CoxS/CutS family)